MASLRALLRGGFKTNSPRKRAKPNLEIKTLEQFTAVHREPADHLERHCRSS